MRRASIRRADAVDLDVSAFGRWFGANTPLTAELIGGGASNLTYAVGDDLVVRRGPAGAFLPTAHDMSREYRFISALGPTDVPVPKAHGYCDDQSVIGVPFYVMERMRGVVPEKPSDVEHFDEAQRTRIAEEMVDVLAKLHAVDFREVGLADIAKHEGYLERQLKRWAGQWERSKTGDLEEMDELFRRLEAQRPEQRETTIVHGDYRLGNTMYDADARLIAVFDWEMATLGDPLADVGYTLIYWGTSSGIALHPSQAIPDMPGFFDRDALVERYAAASGRDVTHVDWYVVLAHVKLAIIGAGGMARRFHALGQEPSGVTDAMRPQVQKILEISERLT